MAESIRIEIPVSVQDSTDPALSQISGKLNKLASSAKKVNKLMNPTVRTSGLEKTLSGVERKIDSVSHRKIDIGVSDDATHTIAGVEDAASRLSGMSATMEISAADDATAQIADVEDAAAALNGNDANVELGADDTATGVIGDVDDAVSALDGNDAIVDIGADDSATNVIADVEDALASLNGQGATIEINAEDNTGLSSDSSKSSGGGSGGLSLGGSMMGGAAGRAVSEGRGVITAAAGIAGMGLGVTAAIQTFGDFESEMSHVKAISGATEEQFASLTNKAKELGATTKFTATESAQAFGYMAMAGWKPEQMEAGIDGVINLAAASGESIASVSDIVTDAMTAFGLDADQSTHFADVLAQSAASSNTNVGMLGESFKYIAPLAGAMGYSIEDVGIALGLMANAGVKGSMAGTSLRTAISNLAAPTDQMQAAMEKYGISLVDEYGNMKTLAGVMENTRESLRGLSEDEQAAAVKTIFGKNAMSGMLAIINASDQDYQNLTNSINSADGAAGRMADTMMDNMQGSLTLLSSQWDQVLTSFGGRLAPYITAGANALKEALPGVEEKINEIFDGVDEKIFNMTNTKEWTEADFFGKVNIAWDTLIADPFREWADSSGASTIADIVGGLFSNALDTLPGGDEAQLTDWLSLGALVIAGEKIAGVAAHVYDLGQKVGGFSWGALGSAGMTAVGIAAAAAAILGVVTAIDAYNERTIQTSLDEHFGDISLSEEQQQALADQILDVPMMANVRVSLNELKDVEKLRSDAEAKLKDNDALEYMAKIGVKLSEEENAIYLENAQGFIDDVEKSISDSAGALSLVVTSLDLKTEDGQSIGTLIDQWATDDVTELNSLSAQYTDAVQDALAKGLKDVDANALVEELQAKILEIQERWAGAERRAADKMLQDEIGESLANLDAESFEGVMTKMQERRESDKDTFSQLKEKLYTLAYAQEENFKEAGISVDDVLAQIEHAEKWSNRLSLINSMDMVMKGLNDAYNEEITGWQNGEGGKETQADTFEKLNYALQPDEYGNVNYDAITEGLHDTYANGFYNNNADAGLQEMYSKMKPNTEELASIVDEYAKAGKEVPAELMSAYNSAIELGAASGDESAGIQRFANSLVESGQTDLINAIQQGFVGDDELRSALSRALLTPVEGMEESLDEFSDKMHKNVEEANKIIDEETSHIADEPVSPNMEGVFKGGGETEGYAYGRGVGQTVETEVTVNTTATPGETDTSEVAAAVEEDVQGAIESDPVESDGEASVNLTQTNNADEVRSGVQSDLDSALQGIPVSATANVSVTWTLANGTNSLNSSEGASVPISVALAHSATGRFVDSPLLSLIGEDGPEYVIPVGADKHRRGLDLWMQAGEDLGVQGFAEGYSPSPVSTSSAPVPVSIGGGTNNNNANVKFNPKINVNGMDGAAFQAAMNKKLQEYADSMAGELADMLSETYENRPVA